MVATIRLPVRVTTTPGAARADPLAIAVLPQRAGVRLVLRGALCGGHAPQLADAVEDLLEVGFDDVVVDLSALDGLDAGGVRALLALRASAAHRGHGFALVPGGEDVQRAFLDTGARGLFAWRSAP
jgi:anti-anti-sigma regulatory factor